jgi:lysophospholipase L1-like esterase
MTSIALLAWTLAGLSSVGWAVEIGSPPIHARIDRTSGPPKHSCGHDLARARDAKAARKSWSPAVVPAVPRSPVKSLESELAEPARQVDSTLVRWADVRAGLLPGANPDALPLQPLEGDYGTLKEIGDVLRDAEAGLPVRISAFGASHTGGDFFTGQVRRTLQDRYGDRGHGFVFPAALYEGHRANDINLCSSPGWRSDWVGRSNSRWDGLHGFTGASVSTSDPLDFAWIQTTADNTHGRSWNRIQVWALGQPGGGSLELVVDDADPIVVSTMRPGAELIHLVVDVPDGAHRATVRTLGDGEIRLFGISGERQDIGVVVDAIGIRGRTAKTWLSWAPELRDPGLAGLDPDLVILAYGTNEAADTDYSMPRYREDLTRVMTAMRAVLPDAACILVGPSDRAKVVKKGKSYAIWGRTAPVAQVQREVAPSFGCAFWDWQMAQGGPGGMLSWRAVDPPLAGWDYIHFTQPGYEQSAALFVAALDDAATITGGLRSSFPSRGR